MKRLLKSWVFWAFIAVPGMVTFLSLIHHELDGQVCYRCFSERWESKWKVGVKGKGAWPLWPVGVSIVESNVHRDGWTASHEHRWYGIAQNEPFAYAGSGELLGRYEGYPEFRAFMLGKRGRGELAREDFLAALEFPGGLSCRVVPEDQRLRRDRMNVVVVEFLRKTYRP